ncbi:MAG: hypothetical protein K2X08_01605 [Chlamydiales bacterium]|nr:hypothetical protein [Chlamydiales bacterium]
MTIIHLTDLSLMLVREKNKIFYYTAEMKMTATIPFIYMNEPYEEALKIVETTSRPNQD